MKIKTRAARWFGPVLALCLGLALLLGGCGGAQSYDNYTDSYDMMPMPEAPAAEGGYGWDDAEVYDTYGEDGYYEGETYEGPSLTLPQDDRKIVMNAWLYLDTTDFEATTAALQKAAQEAGGYTSYTSQSGSKADVSRYAYYTFRIPAEKYSGFLTAAEGAGTVTSRDESAQDVTDQYIDVEARLKSLRAQEKRLLEMMSDADKLADLILVQEQLTEVQYEIESYVAMQRSLDEQTTYSTVEVGVSEVRSETLTGDAPYNSEVRKAFRESWQMVGDTLRGLGIALVYAIPVLVLAVVALIVVLVVRHVLKKRRKAHPKPEKPAGPPPPPVYYTGGLTHQGPGVSAPPSAQAGPPPAQQLGAAPQPTPYQPYPVPPLPPANPAAMPRPPAEPGRPEAGPESPPPDSAE